VLFFQRISTNSKRARHKATSVPNGGRPGERLYTAFQMQTGPVRVFESTKIRRLTGGFPPFTGGPFPCRKTDKSGFCVEAENTEPGVGGAGLRLSVKFAFRIEAGRPLQQV
jgi:hypothetical protein